MNKEDIYTSTGVKFWKHPSQMNSYKNDEGQTIISTHISPESSCNLNCLYCSVSNRKKRYKIELPVIKKYIKDLKSRGLKAVIITGGGEPLLYPQINDLILWLKKQNLELALITNGTLFHKLKDINLFSWIRISINLFDSWDKMVIPESYKCVIGGSFIYNGESIEDLLTIKNFSIKNKLSYVRFLPNCLLDQKDLKKSHEDIDKILKEIDCNIFFHQNKNPRCPNSNVCHQSFFRPYLSEINGGTVFPCDSVVLNNKVGFFENKYKICNSKDILKYLDKKILPSFSVKNDCNGCVFANNIEQIEQWKTIGKDHFNDYPDNILHENFI